MKKNLTEKQQKIFNIIENYYNEYGHSPTIFELQKTLKLKSSRSITQYLEALEKKGFISRDWYGERSIVPVRKRVQVSSDTVDLQVVGFAGCDNQSILANPIYDEYISVSKGLVKNNPNNFMAIRAVGNSMNAAGISDGDTVLVEKTEQLNNNDRVLAVIDESAVIKRIKFKENSIVLNPDSKEKGYSPIIMQKDFKVFGKVIDVIERPKGNEEQIIPINE